MKHRSNPVFQDQSGKWWFWNEIWTDRYGPYDSKEKVAEALYNYCVNELGIPKEEIKQYEPARQD